MKNWFSNIFNYLRNSKVTIIFLVITGILIAFFAYDNKLLLEYLKVLLNWPVIIFFLLLTIIHIFKEPISKWVADLKIDYGGASFYRNQSQIKSDMVIPSENEINSGNNTSRDVSVLRESEIDFKNLAQQWKAAAYMWEYRYLNYYLVYYTKAVLHWLYKSNQSVNIEVIDSFWRQLIPDPNERMAIINALKQHYLIAENNNVITITDKGKEYTEFMLKPIFERLN